MRNKITVTTIITGIVTILSLLAILICYFMTKEVPVLLDISFRICAVVYLIELTVEFLFFTN